MAHWTLERARQFYLNLIQGIDEQIHKLLVTDLDLKELMERKLYHERECMRLQAEIDLLLSDELDSRQKYFEKLVKIEAQINERKKRPSRRLPDHS